MGGCVGVSPSTPFTHVAHTTTLLSVVTHGLVVHSGCAGDMSGSSSEEEEEEEETEKAEGGLEMLVAGKRLEEVRSHLFMSHHQFDPSSSSPFTFFFSLPPLSLLSPSSLPPLSLLSPSSLPPLSLLSPSSLPPLSLLSPSSPSSLPPLSSFPPLPPLSLKGMSDRRGSIQCRSSC